MNTLEILKRSDLFRELNDEQLKVIEKMCRRETFEPGAVICKQGGRDSKTYIVEDGLVGIILEVGPLFQRQVQSASKFETFGWSGMIEPHIYTATVKAIKKTTALGFNGQELFDLCSTHPEIGSKVYRSVAHILSKRLKESYTQLLGVTNQ